MFREIYNRMVARPRAEEAQVLEGPGSLIPIEYRKRVNARRYILRVNAAGNGGCVTIPRGGSLAEARSFAKRNARWLEERLRRHTERQRATGEGLWFRGEKMPLAILETHSSLSELIARDNGQSPAARLKNALWKLASNELPARVAELAAQHGLTVRRVSVRDQRSRWGSCSARGVVSLNWRLVQTPEFVRDYIIVHELMHLRQMNHSQKFWKLVEEAFPRMDEAEKWLKAHSGLLRNPIA
jgi:predicted metal-dependent hydrolase